MELCLMTLDTLHSHISASSQDVEEILLSMEAKKAVYKDQLREVHTKMVSYGLPIADSHVARTRLRTGRTRSTTTNSAAAVPLDNLNKKLTKGRFPRGTNIHKRKIHYERVEKELYNKVTGINIIIGMLAPAIITMEDHFSNIGEMHRIGWSYRERIALTEAEAAKFAGAHAAHDAAVIFLNDTDSALRMLQHIFILHGGDVDIEPNDDGDDNDDDGSDHDDGNGDDKDDGNNGTTGITTSRKRKGVPRATYTRVSKKIIVKDEDDTEEDSGEDDGRDGATDIIPIKKRKRVTRVSLRISKKVVPTYDEHSEGEKYQDDENDADYAGSDVEVKVERSLGYGVVGGSAPLVA